MSGLDRVQVRRALRYPGTVGLALLLIVVLVNVVLQPGFFEAGSMASLFDVALPLILVSFAQTLVILSGGIDLSVGGILSLVDAFIVVEQTHGGFFAVAAFALGLSAFVGLVNGLTIVYLRVQPLVATLATSFVATGAALLLLPEPGGTIPGAIASMYSASYLGLAFPVLVIIGALLLWWAMTARYGRWIYAVGGSETNALRNAVPVNRVRVWTYLCAGVLSGLAGVALTIEVASGDASVGASYLLPSIAAVVLGGTRLTGGHGAIVGSLAGALVLTIIGNIVFFAGIPSYFQTIVSSAIVLLGIASASSLIRFDRQLPLSRSRAS